LNKTGERIITVIFTKIRVISSVFVYTTVPPQHGDVCYTGFNDVIVPCDGVNV